MERVREAIAFNAELADESTWLWLTSEQMGFPLRPTGGGEHEKRAEDLDSSQGVRDHLAAYHLAPAITDFISDENRVCCNNDKLFRSEVEFLVFLLSAAGWAPTESKVKAIVEWPAPETVKHLRSFWGMANSFKTFLPLYLEMSAPLTDLLKNTKHGQHSLNWTLECKLAFAKIKKDLTSAPVLRHFDPSLRTAVHIDSSQNSVWAVLLQWLENEENSRPVAFMSQKLSGAQYRYDARMRRMMMIAFITFNSSLVPLFEGL